ncbi:hypothetical protein EJB05_38538 [Eragrostis curvula]|uniref:Uncharacterized protein n=1 Tax=Eragrostis curvula TaxID=38414 RepID=A0A5J9TW42_9POAL|nr:hypothetical protein EJB05_38538 [Eragrostis curvula]
MSRKLQRGENGSRRPNPATLSPAMPALRSPFAGGNLPAGYVDPDYLYFLQHIRLDGDSYTLELPAQGDAPPSVVRYEVPLASSDGECVSDPSTGRLSTNRGSEEKESSASVEAEPAWCDSLGDVDEDYRLFLQHTRLVDGQLVFEMGGVVINYDQGDSAVSGVSFEAGKDKRRGEEVNSRRKMLGAGGDREEGVALAAPATPVPKPAAAAGNLKGVYWEASSSNGRDAGLPAAVAGKVEKVAGVVWPAHINQRPDSDFKQRLIQVLSEPGDRAEYYNLFDMATLRSPLMKLRQVRNDTKFYPTEAMGSSYLDHYPDLAEQIMNTGSRHGLALMRGLFFWLQLCFHPFFNFQAQVSSSDAVRFRLVIDDIKQDEQFKIELQSRPDGNYNALENAAHEDQFRPWVDDSKGPEVIPLVD